MRSAVILVVDDQVALIERIRDGRTYYLFPGGTVEANETPEAAAIRESYEELGVEVQLHGLAAVATFRHQFQYYYHATAHAGEFGTGTGEELTSAPASPSGSYCAVWLPQSDLSRHDVRPQALAQALAAGLLSPTNAPLHIHEA